MSAAPGSFERTAWVAVTAVLATALAWSAVAWAAVLAGTCAQCPPAVMAVLKVAAHVAPALARAAAGPVMAAGLVAGLLALLLVRDRRGPAAESRHA